MQSGELKLMLITFRRNLRLEPESDKNKALAWLEETQESQSSEVMLESGMRGQNHQDILSSFIFLE